MSVRRVEGRDLQQVLCECPSLFPAFAFPHIIWTVIDIYQAKVILFSVRERRTSEVCCGTEMERSKDRASNGHVVTSPCSRRSRFLLARVNLAVHCGGEGAALAAVNRQEHTPTCVIIPPGRSVDRALELLPYVKGIGRPTMVVASSEQPFLPTQADVVLPVPQAVPEVFSPLVYCLAGELLAYYLAEVRGAEFFQAARSFRSSGDRLRDSHTLRHPDELELLGEEAEG